MKHKITNEVLRKLKKAVQRAPAIPLATRDSLGTIGNAKVVRQYTGEEILGGSDVTKTKDGEGINRNKVYNCETKKVKNVNHLRKMKIAYRKGGWPAVDEYIDKVNKFVKNNPSLLPKGNNFNF